MSELLRREGDRFVWQLDDGYFVQIDKLRESSDHVHAELSVTRRNANGTFSRIHAFRENLTSSQTFDKLCNRLKKASGSNNGFWEEALPDVFQGTIDLHREGAPWVDMAKGVADTRIHYAVWPILLENHPTILFSGGGAGKGWTANAIALSVATGHPFLPGVKVNTVGPVLYLDWEVDDREEMRRLELLAQGRGIEREEAPIEYRQMTRTLANDIDAVRRKVAAYKPVLIILDSLALAAGGNVNNTEISEAFTGAIRLLPCTKLIIAHTSKAGMAAKGNERATVLGTVMFENVSRSVWELKADPTASPLAIALYHNKTNIGRYQDPMSWSLHFDDEATQAWFAEHDITQAEELLARLNTWDACRAFLEKGDATTRELAERTGIKEGTVHKTLQRYKARGRVFYYEHLRKWSLLPDDDGAE